MNRIITSFAADPSIQQPLTVKSLDFLQDANKEMINALCQGMITARGYDPTASVPYKIATIEPLPSYYIYYLGELYYMGEILGGNNIAVLTITNSPTADPLTFTDSVARNVHNIRALVPTTGTLGTGLFNLSSIVDINDKVQFQTTTTEPTGDYTIPATVQSVSNVFEKRINNFTNELELRGFVEKGTATGPSSIVIHILPVNERPTRLLHFTCPVINGGGVYNDNYNVFVFPNGNITCQLPNNYTICLSSIKFSLD